MTGDMALNPKKTTAEFVEVFKKVSEQSQMH